MFLNSIVQAQGDIGDIVAHFIMYSAVLTAFYFSTIQLSFLFETFKLISLLGLSGFVYIVSKEPIDLTFAIARGYTWTEMFYYTPLFWAVIPAVILSFLYDKNLILFISYWILAVILNLIFLKRYILVDSVLLLLVLVFINYHKEKKIISGLKIYVLITILVGIGIYFASDFITVLLDATNQRMDSSVEDVSSFDRFVEHRNYFENEASLVDFLIGKGFSAYHRGLGEEAYALHNGWANFIFKGGVIWLIIILIPFFKIIFLLGRFKILPLDIQFSVSLLLISVPQLFYTNMDNFEPVMIVFFSAIFKIADYKYSQIFPLNSSEHIL
jgi:hypothetical protein